ncbi:Potassium channel subfamily K member 6 [Schistosoma japonicum]|nr:Potassium channel subfamily K member 6 [Schistosoma japonicum]KAH8867629.1 Potassium channel subfamily K member 6 [Schistosoma japonicum]
MNVVLVSVLASLCMPTIRKTRNALVNFYSHSRNHGTHHKDWKHQNSFAMNDHAKVSDDKMCSNNKNENTLLKLCFKLKFLVRKQANNPAQQNESNGFRKLSSNSHPSNNIEKNSLPLAADNIVDQESDIENERFSNKTASLTTSLKSSPTNRIPESFPPVKPVNIPEVFDSEKVSHNFPKHEQPIKPLSSIMKHHELQGYNDNPVIDLSASSIKTDRHATLSDHTGLPKKLRQGVYLSFNTKNYPNLTDNSTSQLNSPKSLPSQLSELDQDKAQNVSRPDPHLIGEPSKDTTHNLRSVNDCFSTETSLADRAHLSCIAFLHYLLSRSDLALTTQVKLSQFRYITVQHVVICSILIPAIIFSHLEHNWTYFDAIYFCIISLSAVGFGDMVASEIYLVLGTTLIAVLVRSFQEIIDYEFSNVTGGHYNDKFNEHMVYNSCSEIIFDDVTPSSINSRNQSKHTDIQ